MPGKSMAAPQISSISPNSQYIEQNVTIAGTGFSSQGNTVTFTNNVTASISSESTTEIRCSVPQGASDGSVTVKASGSTSNGYSFTVKRPVLNSVTPNTGSTGSRIILAGEGFSSTPSSNTVSFATSSGTANGSVVSSSTTQITVDVPQSAISGSVNITSNGFTTGSKAFIVTSSSISSVSPSTGGLGEVVSVTITGINTSWDSDSTVTLSGTESEITVGTPTVNSATEIVVSLTISDTAESGSRNVIVTTSSVPVTLQNGFTVNSSVPTLSGWGIILIVFSILFFHKNFICMQKQG